MLVNAKNFKSLDSRFVEPYFIQTDSAGRVVYICERLFALLDQTGYKPARQDLLAGVFSSLSTDKLAFYSGDPSDIPSWFEVNFDKINTPAFRMRWMSSPIISNSNDSGLQLTGVPLKETKDLDSEQTDKQIVISEKDTIQSLSSPLVSHLSSVIENLDNYSNQVNNLLDGMRDGFFALDSNFEIVYCNKEAANMLGLPANDLIGSNLLKALPDKLSAFFKSAFSRTMEEKISLCVVQYVSSSSSWIELNVYPSGNGIFVCSKDISSRRKQEMLLALERRVLEITSSPNAALKTTIDYLLLGLEEIFPDMICSVLLLAENKKTIVHLSAPSLPPAYCEKINGINIGENVGSCGTAMHLKRRVVVENIATDPLWIDYKELALEYNLQACWSHPILNSEGEALGSFATYYYFPKRPASDELITIQQVVNLIRIIIENKMAADHIRVSNERYQLATKATNDVIWDWDMEADRLIWSEAFYSHYGNERGLPGNWSFFESLIHPDDYAKVTQGIREFVKLKEAEIWSEEFRIRKADGKYAMVSNRTFLVCDAEKRPQRLIGSMQDITEKRKLEKKLLKQEVDKQKSVTYAVIQAQEKERAEIGKELHDNVNQMLSTGKLYLEMAKTNEEERLHLIELSTENISISINEISNITKALVPAMVVDLGLMYSVNDLVENLKKTNRINIEFYSEGDCDEELDDRQKLMLFRIIQEQLKNVIEHAEARNLIIELFLSEDNKNIELNISDDGKGFDPDLTKKGLGFSNIMSRVDLFEGNLRLVTSPGEGCKLRIFIPIQPIQSIHNLSFT